MGTRLYQFFVTDDRARWQAFMVSASLATAAGTGLFVLGLDQRIALLSVSLISIATFSTLALRYSLRQPMRQRKYALLESRRNILVWVKLLVVAAADWLVGFALSDTATALAFADAAGDGVRKDKVSASIPRLILAKAIIESQMVNAPKSTRPELISAQAMLSSAKTYAYIRQKNPTPVETRNETRLEYMRESLDRPVWWIGQSRSGVVLHYGGSGSFIAIGRDLIIDSMTIEASQNAAPQRQPNLIKLIGEPHVIVKNCTIRSFSQNLSHIVWFDVLFDGCSIELPGNNLILVNVSFKNCSISCDDVVAREAPELCVGDASGITFEI